MEGFIELNEGAAEDFIGMALFAYIYNCEQEGINLARCLCDLDGDNPPIDEMIQMILMEEGRLLTAGDGKMIYHRERGDCGGEYDGKTY